MATGQRIPANKMKHTLLILGLVVVLAGAAWFGRSLWKHPMTASPTPDPMIVVDAPKPGAEISSPLKVTGKARGTWYFEASFPVQLTDASGKVIATVPAQAKGDWMTTEFVPFEATLTFSSLGVADGSKGTLILRKDNPSGLPEHDDSREIPVVFKKN